MHGLLSTVAHGEAIIALRSQFGSGALRHALILEADYRWVEERNWTSAEDVRDHLSGIGAFVATDRWQFLRVGYMPIGDSHGVPPVGVARDARDFVTPATPCPPSCLCEPAVAGV